MTFAPFLLLQEPSTGTIVPADRRPEPLPNLYSGGAMAFTLESPGSAMAEKFRENMRVRAKIFRRRFIWQERLRDEELRAHRRRSRRAVRDLLSLGGHRHSRGRTSCRKAREAKQRSQPRRERFRRRLLRWTPAAPGPWRASLSFPPCRSRCRCASSGGGRRSRKYGRRRGRICLAKPSSSALTRRDNWPLSPRAGRGIIYFLSGGGLAAAGAGVVCAGVGAAAGAGGAGVGPAAGASAAGVSLRTIFASLRNC